MFPEDYHFLKQSSNTRSTQTLVCIVLLELLLQQSWSSNTLAAWWEEPTHWKRPWCWERLGAGRKGDNRGWDDRIASPTQWTWTWANLTDTEGQGAWRAVVHGVKESQTCLSDEQWDRDPSVHFLWDRHLPGFSTCAITALGSLQSLRAAKCYIIRWITYLQLYVV